MNVVALRSLPVAERTPPLADGRVAQVEIFDDIAAAAPFWHMLERGPVLATPYQFHDFLRLWQHHVGAAAGVVPFIVVGFNAAGSPLFLWPLGCRMVGGMRVVEFLGGKHANFNMGLWRRDVAARMTNAELREVLAWLAPRADVLALQNQPLTWGGATNPLVLLPHQRSANLGFSGALVPDFEALLRARTNAATRKKMRKKERALAGYGTVKFAQVTEPCEIRRVLDVFLKQKSARMRMLGVPDVFAAPGVRRFIEAAATESDQETPPPIELYALTVDDIVVATMAGVVGGRRFCAMFNSIAQGRYAVESPGEQMIVNLVRACCARGLDTFDLGIGEAHYKNLFCPDAEPLIDSYLPLSSGGRLLAWAYRGSNAVKRFVKQRAVLWRAVCALRRLGARISGRP